MNEMQDRFLSKAGHNNYKNPKAPEKLIRYITRTNRAPKNDLIAWGGIGITEFQDVDSIIGQFYLVQKLHTRRGSFGRYIDHEIYSFSTATENLILENNLDVDKIAREMAQDFYIRDHCQVIYGVHAPSDEDTHMHIHFAINTVDYIKGNKRHENKNQTRERGERFQKIVASEISRKGSRP